MLQRNVTARNGIGKILKTDKFLLYHRFYDNIRDWTMVHLSIRQYGLCTTGNTVPVQPIRPLFRIRFCSSSGQMLAGFPFNLLND